MGNVQRSQHVSRRNAIDTNARMGPLHGQRACQMSNSSLGSIVRCLWLRYVHNSTGHAPNHNHRPLRLSLKEMFSVFASPEVGTINVDTPELIQAVRRIGNGVKILREASRSNKMVDLAMFDKDLGQAGFDGLWVRDIGEVGSDFGLTAVDQQAGLSSCTGRTDSSEPGFSSAKCFMSNSA